VSARLGKQAFVALALVSVGVLCAIAAPNAHAATTRAEYVAQVDPICQAGLAQESVAEQRLNKQIRRLKKHEGSRKARARSLRRQSRALRQFLNVVVAVEQGVNAQIATVPPATEDTSLVQVWLRVRSEELDLSRRMSRAFAKDRLFAGLGLFFDLLAKADEEFDLVQDFGFKYCTVPPPDLGL
jgi:hypothetical protein